MKPKNSRLFSIVAPFATLPLMDFHVSEIPDWFAGTEFKLLVSQILTQIFSGFVDG